MESNATCEDEGENYPSAMSSGESIQVPEEIQETHCAESQPTNREDFAKLHIAIENGDMETVKRVVENHEDEQHFCLDGTSALYEAFRCKKHEIISFLIHSGARFVGSEDEDVYYLDIYLEDLNLVNHYLFDYNKKSERSCFFKLMFVTQSPQVLDADRHQAVMEMYERLCESKLIKVLLKVLENVDFDIVLDFNSDKINRVYRLCEEESEVFGLTLTNVREIFIGAQNLLSDDRKKKAKVYGVLAEELCHLALTIVFQNDAKPYSKEDSSLIHEFREIICSVEALKDRSCHMESVIEDIYGYNEDEWECELIARVPHVIGIYGEESGRRILQESSELCRLLIFYENNVLPKCREYVDASLNTKSDRIMKQIKEKNDFISFKEKRIKPLKDDFSSFRDFAVVKEGVHVISTNCMKLCALQVYHELKPEYGEELERKCLFFSSECFEKKRDEILNALKCKLFYYLVLIVDDKELNHQRLKMDYLDNFEEIESEGINVLVISNSHFLGTEYEDNFVEYNWDDLTDEYQDFRTRPVEYVFKRERMECIIKREDVLRHFSEEDIRNIINGDLIEVQDCVHPNYQDYNPETYVEREFWTIVIDRSIFKEFSEDTVFLIHGLQRWECKELSINESCVQWLEGTDDEIQEDKLIFVCNNKFPMNFDDFVEKTTVKNRICLKYDRKVFYLMDSEGDVFEEYEIEIVQTEEEIIDWLKYNKSLIVSENAGCGKSTVMSRLIRRVKERIHNSWVLRVDLNKFTIKDEDSDSEEEMYEDIFLMFGFKNGFERCHFRKEAYKNNCFIFLDAFDEIPSEYKSKALELISFLRNKSDARIMITTRMHHQSELEEILNTFSHQLVPFDNFTQVTYLGNLWKWKLKFPNEEGQNIHKDKKAISEKIKSIIGELEKEKLETGLVNALTEINLGDRVDSIRKKIDGLELNGLADSILNKSILDEETLEFMGIPLHLFMTGIIYWDSNFNVSISSGIHNIYTQFIEKKILIYIEEKQGIFQYGPAKKKVIKDITEDAYRIHIKFAKQFMDEGKIDCEMSENDFELCKSLGIVFIIGEDVEFLHLTFAEYFLAESIRLQFDKEKILDVLFERNFIVVRRFLENSLKEKNFENLSENFFSDDGFLIDILKKFVDEHFSLSYEFSTPQSIYVSAANIVKRLLDEFEKTVAAETLDAFVLGIEAEIFSLKNWFIIGGCISKNVAKMLINRNFEVNSKIVFGVGRYYSDPEEVIEILDECISTADRCKPNESDKAGTVLEILTLTSEDEWSLFDYALSNEKLEIFIGILEYSKKVLGNEKFIDEIIESEEYRKAMDFMIQDINFYKGIELIRSFYSVFGKETEVFFDQEQNIRIIGGSLRNPDKSRNAFQETINLFIEYFGTSNLNKTLLSCDSRGDNLINHLMMESVNVIENLNIIRNTLDDKSEMKQFLMLKDRDLRNVFHLAAKWRNDDFGEILMYCREYLENWEIKEMLISCDTCGRNVLYLLFEENSSERIFENLNLISKCLANEDLFKEILKSEDNESSNISHYAATNKYCNFKDLLVFCGEYLDKQDMKQILSSCDGDGWNLLPLLFKRNSCERITDNLNLIKSYVADEGLLKRCLKSKYNKSMNIFHYAATNECHNFEQILVFINEYLEKEEIKEMVSISDEEGWNVLHSLIGWNSSETIIKYLNLIKKYIDDECFFKDCLKRKDYRSRNIFHCAAGSIKEVNISFLNSHLSKNEIKKLLIERDKNGWTCLHYGGSDHSDNLLNLINYSFEIMKDDQLQFEELIMATERRKCTFLHLVVRRTYSLLGIVITKIIESLKEKVPDEVFKEFLRNRNSEGETILLVVKRINEDIIKEIENVLEKDFIEELLEIQKK